MDIYSVQKFIVSSPKKLRPTANMIKKLTPSKALDILPHIESRSAKPLEKVIRSAIANAKDRGFSEDNLIFKEIQINEGPRLKRGRPVSRGRWHPYKRRMSHIRVVLAVGEKEKELKKSGKKEAIVKETKSKIKNEKSKIQSKDLKRNVSRS